MPPYTWDREPLEDVIVEIFVLEDEDRDPLLDDIIMADARAAAIYFNTDPGDLDDEDDDDFDEDYTYGDDYDEGEAWDDDDEEDDGYGDEALTDENSIISF